MGTQSKIKTKKGNVTTYTNKKSTMEIRDGAIIVWGTRPKKKKKMGPPKPKKRRSTSGY